MLSMTPRKESSVTRENAAANQFAKFKIVLTVFGVLFLLEYYFLDILSRIRVMATKKVATTISSIVE